tara:strand:- start:9857 stop:10630 length:774 start_codon:yes stop_codon:yes gene_type:complete
MISIHPDTNNMKMHSLYSNNYISVKEKDMHSIAKAAITFVNSPLIWEEGRRKQMFFLYTDYIVLDFDEPKYDLEQAVEIFSTYKHAIITTKRHKKLSPRYRVWLKLNKRCDKSNGDNYKYSMKKSLTTLGGDLQTIDLSRKYVKGKDIISVSNEGKEYTLKNRPPVVIKPLPQFFNKDRHIPKWVREILEGKTVPNGSKNYCCYSLGKILGGNGFSESEIIEMIFSAGIPADPSKSETVSEVRSAVQSGLRNKQMAG